MRSFPTGEGKWRVSTNGGTAPRWRRDGKELFYVERKKLMAVSVTADGKRFIVREKPVSEKPLAVHGVQNWFEEFRRLPQE